MGKEVNLSIKSINTGESWSSYTQLYTVLGKGYVKHLFFKSFPAIRDKSPEAKMYRGPLYIESMVCIGSYIGLIMALRQNAG